MHGMAGLRRDVGRLLVAAVCLIGLMVALGYLLTHVLPPTAFGRWDAQIPARLVKHRQGQGFSESAVITTLSATPTIVVLTAVTAAVFRWVFGRWRESAIVVCAVAGETAVFMATTLLIHRPRPLVPRMDVAPPTSSFPSGHTAAAVCFYGSVAVIMLWHSRNRWVTAATVVGCAAVPLVIGASRVYRGMHYPTDVLGGLILGGIWLSVVLYVVHVHDAGHASGDTQRRFVSRSASAPR